ncbi:MAG: ATP-binding protein [Desulfobacterales bacterium]|nr:ATP-binding protein [Desulfobacterales bacterium]
MSGILHRLTRSITGKLVIVISLFTILGTSLSLFTTIRAEKKNSMADALTYITSFSDLMRKSIRHDMMNVSPEDIQKTLEFFGTSDSIENVRVLDHTGRISYASFQGEVGSFVSKGSSHCTGCHAGDTTPLPALEIDKRWSIAENPDNTRTITFAEPIYNESDCHTAECHAHGSENKVLGILLTDFSLQTIDTRIEKQVAQISLFIILVVVIIAAILCIILWSIVLKPLIRLTGGMQRVSSGDISQKVNIQSDDEIGRLASTFNTMTDELTIARQRMEEWTQTLVEEVYKQTRVIKQTQDKLIQAEKMAALGRVTADIAHEIRNPLTALGGFGRRLLKSATSKNQKKYAEVIVSESDRLEQVLKDVLIYSKNVRTDFEKDSVNGIIAKSIDLYQNICEEQTIAVKAQYNTDLPVLLQKDQVQQAANNLITNAIDAMSDGGTLTISTELEKANHIEYVAVNVQDTGKGIPADKLPLVFEPFFTTKRIGQGTGLGLSICKKIVEEHGGFIKAKNGTGLTISMFFPYQNGEKSQNKPCWEHMQCKQDVNHDESCPAYPHFGRVCWAVAGTFCAGKIQGTYAQKIHDCHRCGYYRMAQTAH